MSVSADVDRADAGVTAVKDRVPWSTRMQSGIESGPARPAGRMERADIAMGSIVQRGLEGGKVPDLQLQEGQERSRRSPHAPGDETAFASDRAEVHYQRLGRWRGADASSEMQEESDRFRRESGLAGIRWLIARLRAESHDDRLRGAAAMLTDLGRESPGPIVEALRDGPAADQALTLLWALCWLGDREESGDPQTVLVLVQYLLDESPELREASARAFRLIPRDLARVWLTRRLREEPDREVRRTIEDELEAAGNNGAKTCIS